MPWNGSYVTIPMPTTGTWPRCLNLAQSSRRLSVVGRRSSVVVLLVMFLIGGTQPREPPLAKKARSEIVSTFHGNSLHVRAFHSAEGEKEKRERGEKKEEERKNRRKYNEKDYAPTFHSLWNAISRYGLSMLFRASHSTPPIRPIITRHRFLPSSRIYRFPDSLRFFSRCCYTLASFFFRSSVFFLVRFVPFCSVRPLSRFRSSEDRTYSFLRTSNSLNYTSLREIGHLSMGRLPPFL